MRDINAHLQAIHSLRDELDAWGDFEQSESTQEYHPDPIDNDSNPNIRTHPVWLAVVKLQEFYPKRRLPKITGALDAWANLCKYSRQHGTEDRVTQRDKAIESAEILRRWVCDEETRIKAEETLQDQMIRQGESGALIERLLAGPENIRLSNEDYHFICAFLNQPANWPTASQLARKEANTFAKLRLIRDYNRNLREQISEKDQDKGKAGSSNVSKFELQITRWEKLKKWALNNPVIVILIVNRYSSCFFGYFRIRIANSL
jgi:hypothetical protein